MYVYYVNCSPTARPATVRAYKRIGNGQKFAPPTLQLLLTTTTTTTVMDAD